MNNGISDIKIGVMLPKSSLYPSIGLDIRDGLKARLSLDEAFNYKFIFENIGHGGNEKVVYDKAEKLIVWVTLNDLRSVAAFDDADVRTFGNISKIEFNVELHNRATASLNIDAFNANVKLTDHAKANLAGTVSNYTLTREGNASVASNNLKADHFTENKAIVIADKNDQDNILGL